MADSGWLVMVSAAMSVEDQNRNLLVKDKEGRGEEEEEEEDEGRTLSWLLLRRKQNRFWEEGAEIEKKKIKKNNQTIHSEGKKKEKQLVKRLLSVIRIFLNNSNIMQENPEELNQARNQSCI